MDERTKTGEDGWVDVDVVRLRPYQMADNARCG